MSCWDLLGRRVKAINCSHETEGLVVGESREALYILRGARVVLVPKRLCDFIDLDRAVLIKGIYLVGYRDVRLLSDKCLSPSEKSKRR
ncbi:MAG: RNase P/RNase MRP subunit p29 [Thermoproteus sp.]